MPARISSRRTAAREKRMMIRTLRGMVTISFWAVLLLGVVLAGAGLSPAQAQSQDAGQLRDLNLSQLANIKVVTANKTPEELWKTPAAIYVITQEDIRRSGATTIPEILRLAPGVEVARLTSNTWAIGIRGFNSSFSKSVLVLIDGRNVYTPLFAGVYWDVQDVLLSNIDHIEIIRGPGGTIWGADAVNGVINIITKSAQDTQGTLVTAGTGNVDRAQAAVRYGNEHGRNLQYRVFAKGFGEAPQFEPLHDDFDDWQMGHAGFRADWQPQDTDKLTVQGDLYKGNIGQQISIDSFSPPGQNDVDGYQDVSGGNLRVRWGHTLANGSSMRLQGYYDRTYRLGVQLGETRDTYDVDFLHNISFHRNDFSWGAGARVSPASIQQIVPVIDFTDHHPVDNVLSAFAQDEIELVPNRLAFTMGAKFEHNNYNGFDVLPSGRLLYTPGPQQTFWAAITRAVRTPSLLDRDLELTDFLIPNPLAYLRVSGNPDFEPETLLGFEAGYRRLITRRAYIDFAWYHNQYHDLSSDGNLTLSVATTPAPQHLLLATEFANGIKGNTDGFEIAPDFKIFSWWQIRSSYSYINLDLSNEPGNADTSTVALYEGLSPHNQVEFRSLLTLPKRVEFDTAYRYVSALPAQSVRSYETVDAHIGWHFSESYGLSLDGANLLQPHHTEFGGLGGVTAIRRSIYGEITWTR